MRKCYVATPVKKFWDRKDWNEHLKIDAIRHEAVKASRLVKQLGCLPISAPQMFIEVLSEDCEREIALEYGRELLSMCECFAYFESDLVDSDGIRSELEIAMREGKRIFNLDRERGFFNCPRVERDSFGVVSLIDSDGSDFALGEILEDSEEKLTRFLSRNGVFNIHISVDGNRLTLVSFDSGFSIVDRELLSIVKEY